MSRPGTEAPGYRRTRSRCPLGGGRPADSCRAAPSPHLGRVLGPLQRRVRTARRAVDTDLETALQPRCEVRDELLAEVAPMPWPALLEGMVEVRPGNIIEVDGVPAEVVEVMGNEGKAAVPIRLQGGIDAVAEVGLAIAVQRDDLIDPHG